MNQKEKIIEMLASGLWICSDTFRNNYVPEFRSVISSLKKVDGYKIEDVRCTLCKHKNNPLTKMWRLLTIPDHVKPVPYGMPACCYSFGKFKVHDTQCKENEKVVITNGLF